jgi:hypothetical protein
VRNLEVFLLPQKDFPYYDGENPKKALACNILVDQGIKCWDEAETSVKPLSPIQNIHQEISEVLENSFHSFEEEENEEASPKIKIEGSNLNDKIRSNYNVPTIAQLPRDSVNQSSSTNPFDLEDNDKTSDKTNFEVSDEFSDSKHHFQ